MNRHPRKRGHLIIMNKRTRRTKMEQANSSYSAWEILMLIKWERSTICWRSTLKFRERILYRREVWFQVQTWDLRLSMMRTWMKISDNSFCNSKYTISKQALEFHIDTSMICVKFTRRNSKWRSSSFTERSSRRVKEPKLPFQEVLNKTRSNSWAKLPHLIWLRRCLIHKQCNSKFKRREQRNEAPNLMKI